MQFIDLKAQYNHLKNRIDTRIKAVLDHGKFIMGPEVGELEEELSRYVDVKHTITCANGTDALQLALMALNIGEGAAVFVPTFTFFASAEAISFVGATPIFVDSDNATFNICADHLESQIKKTIAEGKILPKAIMAVDLFGLPANYPRLKRIANKYNLKIIEDAAQGFGGSIDGKKCGTFGDIATTSFFPAKPLGCYGDGGAIFTDNNDLAELIRSLRVHGKGSNKYDNVRIGMNSRLDTIQAAILLEKLSAFPNELIARSQLADAYNNAFKAMNSLIAPVLSKGYQSSWAQYTLISDSRDDYITLLKDVGIPSVIYYGKCMHRQKAFENIEKTDTTFPVAEQHSKQVFSLPMHPYMDKTTQKIIINKIKEL